MNHKLVRQWSPPMFLPWLDRLQASSINSRLTRGMFWSVVGGIAARGLALIAAVVTARIVGRQVFGELGIIQSTILMFGSFGTLAMGLTTTKFVAEFRNDDPSRAGRILGMSSVLSWTSGLIMALIVVVLAPWLAANTLNAPHLTNVLRLGGLCLVFNVISEAQLGALSGFEAFKRRSTIQLVVAVVSLPLTVAGVYWWGLAGAIAAQTCAQALLVVLNVRGILAEARRGGIRVDLRGSFREMKILWAFTLPTFLGGVLYVPVIWLANTIIVKTGPNGYAEMGLFSAAERWRTAIMLLPSLMGGVALPMLSSLRGKANIHDYRKVLWTNLKASAGAALAAAIPIAILSPWIMRSYGKEFGSGNWVLIVVCGSSVAAAADWIIGQSLFSQGRVWLKFFFNSLWALVFVSTAWYLRAQGALGLASAYLFADCTRLTAAWCATIARGV